MEADAPGGDVFAEEAGFLGTLHVLRTEELTLN